MKLIKNIFILFFGLAFLLSSTGIVIFQSYCECTGDEYVSLYVQPETCEQDFHEHHIHDLDGNEVLIAYENCFECIAHTHDCGCDAPEIKYIKLINQINNDEIKYVKVQSHNIFVAELNNVFDFNFLSENKPVKNFYTGLPPLVKTSLEFLINISQLKIIPFVIVGC